MINYIKVFSLFLVQENAPLRKSIYFTSGENEQLTMSVKYATRAEGECCNHMNWQSLVPHEWNKLFFSTRLVKIVLSSSVLRRENGYFPHSNRCEISHFPVSEQTVKVQFSLNVLGKVFFLSTLKWTIYIRTNV